MYKRVLIDKILDRLGMSPAVAILGPRQIGKTTLAKQIAKEKPSEYLDLMRTKDLSKLKDPYSYSEIHADKLVIIDEVHRHPDLFLSLRGIIDSRREEGRGNGRFLILGSASDKLMKQRSESLAGRIHHCDLAGLNPFEIEQPVGEPLQRLWVRGGFPSSFAAPDDRESYIWRQEFVHRYVNQDLPELGPRIPAATLEDFWTMLAHVQGEVLNASKVAGALKISGVTVSRYLDLMVDLLLVRRLEPWHRNARKRLIKSPRIYIRDSGVLHALLGIPDHDALLGHPVLGKSWEGFVIETIINALPWNVHPFYYRTVGGAEIDLLIDIRMNELWAVEIKAGSSPKPGKGFHVACEDLKVDKKFVVYAGEKRHPIGKGTTALPLAHLLEEIRERIA